MSVPKGKNKKYSFLKLDFQLYKMYDIILCIIDIIILRCMVL